MDLNVIFVLFSILFVKIASSNEDIKTNQPSTNPQQKRSKRFFQNGIFERVFNPNDDRPLAAKFFGSTYDCPDPQPYVNPDVGFYNPLDHWDDDEGWNEEEEERFYEAPIPFVVQEQKHVVQPVIVVEPEVFLPYPPANHPIVFRTPEEIKQLTPKVIITPSILPFGEASNNEEKIVVIQPTVDGAFPYPLPGQPDKIEVVNPLPILEVQKPFREVVHVPEPAVVIEQIPSKTVVISGEPVKPVEVVVESKFKDLPSFEPKPFRSPVEIIEFHSKTIDPLFQPKTSFTFAKTEIKPFRTTEEIVKHRATKFTSIFAPKNLQVAEKFAPISPGPFRTQDEIESVLITQDFPPFATNFPVNLVQPIGVVEEVALVHPTSSDVATQTEEIHRKRPILTPKFDTELVAHQKTRKDKKRLPVDSDTTNFNQLPLFSNGEQIFRPKFKFELVSVDDGNTDVINLPKNFGDVSSLALGRHNVFDNQHTHLFNSFGDKVV